MTWIKEEFITEATNWINELSDEELEQVSEKNVAKNPLLVGYLLSAGIEFENDDVMDFSVFCYNVFVQAAELQSVPIAEINDDDLDAFEEEYHTILSEFGETSDHDLITTFCNQPLLFEFTMNEITGEDENGETLSEKSQTDFFVVGIALVALLNRAIKQ